MPRSTNLRTYPMHFYQAVEAAAKTGELRLTLASERGAKSERLAYYGFRNALSKYLETTPKEVQSRNAQDAFIFIQSLEFIVEGSELILRRSGAPTEAAVAEALRKKGFISSIGIIKPPELPDFQDGAEAAQPSVPQVLSDNPEVASVQQKLQKWVDPTTDILKNLGYFDSINKDSK